MSRIDPRKYGKQTSGGPVLVNIRVRAVPARVLTRADVDQVFASVRDHGTVPRGFQLAAVDWKNPDKATPRWVSGNIRDLDSFGAILQVLRSGHGLKLGVVKRTDPPAFDV